MSVWLGIEFIPLQTSEYIQCTTKTKEKFYIQSFQHSCLRPNFNNGTRYLLVYFSLYGTVSFKIHRLHE